MVRLQLIIRINLMMMMMVTIIIIIIIIIIKMIMMMIVTMLIIIMMMMMMMMLIMIPVTSKFLQQIIDECHGTGVIAPASTAAHSCSDHTHLLAVHLRHDQSRISKTRDLQGGTAGLVHREQHREGLGSQQQLCECVKYTVNDIRYGWLLLKFGWCDMMG